MNFEYSLFDNVSFLLQSRNHRNELNRFAKKKTEDASKVFSQWTVMGPFNGVSTFDLLHQFFMQHYQGAEYHDWYHTCCMIVNCCEAYVYENKGEVNRVELHSLLIAAALHDIAHTGGREPDVVNVARALNLAAEFISRTKIPANGTSTGGVDKHLVYGLISVTQFPFSREPTTQLQKIIRDADLLQILEPTWFEVIYNGLFKEIQRSNPNMDFAGFVRGQCSFLHSAQFYSRWWNETQFGPFGGIGLERALAVRKAYCGE